MKCDIKTKMDLNDEAQSALTHFIKLIVVGEMGCGKTSIIQRYAAGTFSHFYRPSVGVDYANKIIPWKNLSVDINLWDVAGQERYLDQTRQFFQQSVGALVVFDLTKDVTFEVAKQWKKEIDEKARTSKGVPVPTILVGNKVDLTINDKDWTAKRDYLKQFARENNYLTFFEASARDGTNIDQMFYELTDYIMENNIESELSKDLDSGVRIADPANAEPPKKTCC